MTREAYIKKLIWDNHMTIKDFAAQIDMPYSTLLTMLNEEKIGRASVDNVIAVCKGLGISVDELQSVTLAGAGGKKKRPAESRIILSDKEKELISAYRSRLPMQRAVDTLLFSETAEG